MAAIRVLIVDDHALVRQGIRALLQAQADMEVVGEAADGVAMLEPCRRLAPDVVLMDLTMPGRGGIRAIEDVRRCCRTAKVLVVTMHDDEAYARQAFLSGAAGYVLKKSVADELITAIREVHEGRRYVPASLARALESAEAAPVRRGRTSAVGLLTAREKEVLGLLALGHTNAEVAARLHISIRTVETHRTHLLEKLALRNRADLVRFAIEHGLMDS